MLLHCGHDLVDAVEVLRPDRILHPAFVEHPPTAGLAAHISEAGIRAVHRNTKRQRNIPLERSRVVRDQVGPRRVRDQRTNLPKQPRPRQQLRAERRRARVADRDQRQPLTRMAGNDAGKQPEVVLDDRFRNRLRRHVDHPQPRLTEQQQEEQGALLHRLSDGAGGRGGALDADRRHDDHRFVRQVLLDRVPRIGHGQLEAVESLVSLFVVQLAESSGWGL